jgi:hypothetical protein
MSSDRDSGHTKRERQWRLLKAVYEKVDGETDQLCAWDEAGAQIDLGPDEAERVARQLQQAGMVEIVSDGLLRLTEEGTTMTEETILEGLTSRAKASAVPASTPPSQVVNNFHGPVGSVQSGSGNVANVRQELGIAPADVVQLLDQLRSLVESSSSVRPGESAEEALVLVDSLKHEALAANPSRPKMKAFGEMLGKVLTGTAQAVLTSVLTKLLTPSP